MVFSMSLHGVRWKRLSPPNEALGNLGLAVKRGDVSHCMSMVSFPREGGWVMSWVAALSRVSRFVLN